MLLAAWEHGIEDVAEDAINPIMAATRVWLYYFYAVCLLLSIPRHFMGFFCFESYTTRIRVASSKFARRGGSSLFLFIDGDFYGSIFLVATACAHFR